MKKSLLILSALALALFLCGPVNAGQRGHGHDYRKPSRDHRNDPGVARHYKKRDRDRDFDYGKPEHRPPGYRSKHHGHHHKHSHKHKNRSYNYDGHWNSWKAWDKYRKGHPERFHSGRYYREKGHLFFRFCDPAGIACSFFSIGR